MRSLSAFTVLLLALMATMAMFSCSSIAGAVPVEVPSTTDIQDKKIDPPSAKYDDEYFISIKDGEEDQATSPIEVLGGHHDDDDDDYHHHYCHCYWKCHYHHCWKVCDGKHCHHHY